MPNEVVLADGIITSMLKYMWYVTPTTIDEATNDLLVLLHAVLHVATCMYSFVSFTVCFPVVFIMVHAVDNRDPVFQLYQKYQHVWTFFCIAVFLAKWGYDYVNVKQHFQLLEQIVVET
jgi:hypothetical protein